MRKTGFGNFSKSLWGLLYETLGPALVRWRTVALVLCLTVLVCGSWEPVAFDLLLTGAGILFLEVELPVWSSMLTTTGRRQRFCAVLFSALATTIFAVIIAHIASALSAVLALLIPDFVIWGETVSYHRLDVTMVYLMAAVVPLTFTAQLSFRKWPLRTALILILFVLIPFCAMIYLVSDTGSGLHFVRGAPFMVGALVFGWAVFAAALYFICSRIDLAAHRADAHVSL
jgi:hypothetical protein